MLSRSLRDQILDDFLHCFHECYEKLYHIIFFLSLSKRKKSQIEFWNCDIYVIEQNKSFYNYLFTIEYLDFFF